MSLKLQSRSADRYDVASNALAADVDGDFRREQRLTVGDAVGRNLDRALYRAVPRSLEIVAFVVVGRGEMFVDDANVKGRHATRAKSAMLRSRR